jgi:RNA polymerase sigma-70 factor, ECF subfamily
MTEDPSTTMQGLYDEHASALWGFCLRLTGNDRARAEDVAQETMLRAWRNAAVLTESRGSVRSWLFTVARNIVIDEWRGGRSQHEFATAELPQGEVGDDRTDELLLSWVVADALQQLSADHRAVIVECYYRGRSVADAARSLGVPEGTVKSRTHYALRALRLVLEEMGAVS